FHVTVVQTCALPIYVIGEHHVEAASREQPARRPDRRVGLVDPAVLAREEPLAVLAPVLGLVGDLQVLGHALGRGAVAARRDLEQIGSASWREAGQRW